MQSMTTFWFCIYTIFIVGVAGILGYGLGMLQELKYEIRYLEEEQKQCDEIQRLIHEQDEIFKRLSR